MKAIAEGGGVVVRGRPLPKRALRRLFDTSFHEKVYKDLTLRMTNQDVVKDKTLFMTSEQNKNKNLNIIILQLSVFTSLPTCNSCY